MNKHVTDPAMNAEINILKFEQKNKTSDHLALNVKKRYLLTQLSTGATLRMERIVTDGVDMFRDGSRGQKDRSEFRYQ